MSSMPPDSLAYRRTLAAGFTAFFLGLLLTAAGGVYLLVTYVIPDMGWGAIPTALQVVLFFPLLGGGACALGTMKALERWYHWRGVYRCPRCDRPMPGGDQWCVCQADDPYVRSAMAARARRRRQRPRRIRRRGGRALRVYAVVAVLACAATLTLPGARRGPFWPNFILGHALFCALAMALNELLIGLLDFAGRARRFRIRTAALRLPLGIWSLSVILVWLFWK
jgi:hypothetical protein